MHKRTDQLLSKLLIEYFDTLPTQSRHIEHMHEGLWFPKMNYIKKMATENFDIFPDLFKQKGVMLVL